MRRARPKAEVSAEVSAGLADVARSWSRAATRRLWPWVSTSLGLSAGLHGGCVQPECTSADYGNPECRVLVENESARLRTSAGVEIRFQEPHATSSQTWSATGLVRESTPGQVSARVAGPGDFAISVVPPAGGAAAMQLELTNVDPAARVTVGPLGEEREVAVPGPGSTSRTVTINFADGRVQWIRGHRSCPERFRLAVAADIQTNPWQFERIVARLAEEVALAEAAGEPLVGLVIPGDLSEASREDEFTAVAEILARLPVPVAVTAGNHDVSRPLHPQFNRHFGPGNFAFNVCDTRVVLVDTGSGTIAPSVQARLPELLERHGASHLIAAMHHPPFPGNTGAGWSREDVAAQVLVELAAADTDLVVAGHAHALYDFPDISVGDASLREIIVGTAGAWQGVGVPRYGYLRVRFDRAVHPCFVEVPPAGYDEAPGEGLRTLDYCAGP